MSQATAQGTPDDLIIISGVTIDLKQVADMARIGCTDKDMARWHGVTHDAWRKTRERCPVLSQTIEKNFEDLKLSIRRKQLAMLESDGKQSNTMAVWLGKAILGQQETNTHNIKAEGLNINITMTQFEHNDTVHNGDSNDT